MLVARRHLAEWPAARLCVRQQRPLFLSLCTPHRGLLKTQPRRTVQPAAAASSIPTHSIHGSRGDSEATNVKTDLGSSQLSVTTLDWLPPAQQAHIRGLHGLLERAAAMPDDGMPAPRDDPSPASRKKATEFQMASCPRATTLVACRIDCAGEGGTSGTCGSNSFFIGVNHALHARVNSGGGAHPLKGILKGCAEQNALGALAAGGIGYRCATHVYIASRGTATTATAGRGLPADAAVLFPCPECWGQLARVAAMRAATGLPELQLVVWAGTPERAAAAMSVAAARVEKERGHVRALFVTES